MRLSTKGRYAVTAMLDLALNGTDGPVTLADISENQGISLSYLEQLFAALRSKGLVRGVRGPGGGYYLGRESDEISIADIICAVDEWVEFTRCKGKQNCHDGQRCLTHSLWDDLPRAIRTVTEAPARAAGLNDRGALRPGLRGDLLRIALHRDTPILRGVWSRGRPVG